MKPETQVRLVEELENARRKFPSSSLAFVALIEEVGELANAYLDGTHEDAINEAYQVAAMALRLIEDGDPALAIPLLEYSIENYEDRPRLCNKPYCQDPYRRAPPCKLCLNDQELLAQ